MGFATVLMDEKTRNSLSLDIKMSKNKGGLKPRIRDILAGAVLALICARMFPQSFKSLLGAEKSVIESNLAPEDVWKDDIWPIYPVTPWDISTDFPYPRKLEYNVTEGTWLRLDVHPTSSEVVFDMLGDIYCLPSWKDNNSIARPILLGIPHDSDPHFSPAGDRLVFRSDAELGIGNIWVTPWTGCDNMALRPNEEGNLTHQHIRQLSEALSHKDEDANLLAKGIPETRERKVRRLVREGRFHAQRVTNETYRFISDARFHPSGEKVIATKWYFSERSIPAGEGWEYNVASLDVLQRRSMVAIKPGAGKRRIARVLAKGWSAQQYGDQQVGPEQFIWSGNDTIIYAKNVVDEPSGQFEYSKNIHMGIYSIFSRNLTSGKDSVLVNRYTGGASRPELSRDGSTLAFVRRIRDKEGLYVLDIKSGTITLLWDGLTYDLTAIAAPMGTYPSFSFTPDDDAIILWAGGLINVVPLKRNSLQQLVSGGLPSPIRFKASIEKRLAETMHVNTDLVSLETAQWQKLHAFRSLAVDDNGDSVVFEAAGATYIQKLTEKKPVKVPVGDIKSAYYQPSFVPGSSNMIIHSRWSDINFTTFEIADISSGSVLEISDGVPLGRYFSPTICGCSGAKRRLAFIKTGGDVLTGDVIAIAGTGLYIGDIDLKSSIRGNIKLQNIEFIPSELDSSSPAKLQFLEGAKKLLVQEDQRAFIIDFSSSPDKDGKPKHIEVAKGRMSSEIAVSTSENVTSMVSFIDFGNVYIAPGKYALGEGLWSKPGNATAGVARVGLDGGHNIVWSGNGKILFWLLGPYLHWFKASNLERCSDSIARDDLRFGIECTKHLTQFKEIDISYETDIHRLKRQAAARADGQTGIVVIKNATLLTMHNENLEQDLIYDGIMVIKDGIIRRVGTGSDVQTPVGAFEINAEGGFVVPGFIDMHAHWSGFSSQHPATSWEMATFLAYGITTLHNPSCDTIACFIERARVESGKMVGPRIFHTGGVVYGAQNTNLHSEAYDSDDAYSTLLRIKVEGGNASFSYKNYQLPSRAARQRLIAAGRRLGVIALPEGGMNQDWDTTYIIDGMATIEHAMPVPQLFDDVLTLYARSGTGSTPTHLVNYGGVMGEQLLWRRASLPFDEKLRRFVRHDILDTVAETTARPKSSFQLYNTSSSVKLLVDRGARAHIGAHGESPIGSNYHGEMFLFSLGGMSIYDIFRAATVSAAVTLGLDSSLGTLSEGKLADFVIYKTGVNILEDINNSDKLSIVGRNGRLWEADTMQEIWPRQASRVEGPPLNSD